MGCAGVRRHDVASMPCAGVSPVSHSLVLMNVTTPTRSDGLHVQALWIEQEIEEAHGENPIFVHIGPHDILDNHNLSEAVIDSKKGALLLRHLLW